MVMAVPGFEQAPIEWSREYWNSRRLLRALWFFVILVSLVTMAVLIFLVVAGHLTFSAEPHFVAFVTATLFTCLTVPISFNGIHMHLVHESKPHIQRHIVRVLWMVPIYGLNAWLALVLGLVCANERWILLPDAFRQCYEAYTIYSFYRFVYAYIEDKEGRSVVDVLRTKPPMQHLPPLRVSAWTPTRGWFQLYSARPWTMGVEFLDKCTYGVNNYVFVKPLTTLATIVCAMTNVYGDGLFRANVAFPYITFIDNASQMWALYCLILVYLNLHDEIALMRPTMKFLCVKGVVFATFWQSTLLSLLVYSGTLSKLNDGWNWKCHVRSNEVVNALQNFLISTEMLLFAVLHAYAFPSREYRDDRLPPRRAAARLKNLFDVRDVYDDVSRHAETVAGQVAGGVTAVAGSVAGQVNTVADVLRSGKRTRGRRRSGWQDGLGVPLIEEEELLDESELDDDAAWLRIDNFTHEQMGRHAAGAMLSVEASEGDVRDGGVPLLAIAQAGGSGSGGGGGASGGGSSSSGRADKGAWGAAGNPIS